MIELTGREIKKLLREIKRNKVMYPKFVEAAGDAIRRYGPRWGPFDMWPLMEHMAYEFALTNPDYASRILGRDVMAYRQA